MSAEWDVEFHLLDRTDQRKPNGPFEYLGEALKRKSPQRFFVMGVASRHDSQQGYVSAPIVAVAIENVRHTPKQRKLFLDNIVTMLELMEAQRNVDVH